MRRGTKLPIMIGKELNKGILICKDPKMGGQELAIVWLKEGYKTGEEFDTKDIEGIDSILHFCDKESLDSTIKILNTMSQNWERGED